MNQTTKWTVDLTQDESQINSTANQPAGITTLEIDLTQGENYYETTASTYQQTVPTQIIPELSPLTPIAPLPAETKKTPLGKRKAPIQCPSAPSKTRPPPVPEPAKKFVHETPASSSGIAFKRDRFQTEPRETTPRHFFLRGLVSDTESESEEDSEEDLDDHRAADDCIYQIDNGVNEGWWDKDDMCFRSYRKL
jgi:hypothetical protein